jgi:4-oxalocrotonate tautomerase
MPLVNITLGKGRTDAQKRACLAAVANAVHETIGAELETIRVWFSEVEVTDFSVGGVTLDEVRAQRAADAAKASST